MKKTLSIFVTLLLSVLICSYCIVSASDAIFTIGTDNGTPGDTIKLNVELASSIPVNSIAFYDIEYDGGSLEFIGFADYEHLDAKSVMPVSHFADSNKKTILVPLKTSETFSGKLCTIEFKIKDDAVNGKYSINARSIVKNDSSEGISSVAAGCIVVSGGKTPETPSTGNSSGSGNSFSGGSISSGTSTSRPTSPADSPTTAPTPENTIAPAPENTVAVSITFEDLTGYDWAKESIKSLASLGIIKGTSATTYSPSKNITRADFAILLVRAFKLSDNNTENFADVSADDYFAKELAIARNTGIVGGIGNNKFAPRNSITRQDMMTIVHRALTNIGFYEENNISVTYDEVAMSKWYNDYAHVSDYARDAVAVLSTSNLVNGKNGAIAPSDYTTRAEVAVLINRILTYTKK